MLIRCDASNLDLDARASRRSRRMTNALVEQLDLGTLWDDYGIVGDIIVSFNPSAYHG